MICAMSEMNYFSSRMLEGGKVIQMNQVGQQRGSCSSAREYQKWCQGAREEGQDSYKIGKGKVKQFGNRLDLGEQRKQRSQK